MPQTLSEMISHERELREQSERAHLSFHASETKTHELRHHNLESLFHSMTQLKEEISNEIRHFVSQEQYELLRSDLNLRINQLENSRKVSEHKNWIISGCIVLLNIVMWISIK